MRREMNLEGVCRTLAWLYERLLCLYPRADRDELGPEMVWVFGRGIQDAARRGWAQLLKQSLRELRDAPRAILGAWARAFARQRATIQGKRGMEVSVQQPASPGGEGQERIRWASRLAQALIVKLYQQDAQGIVDAALIDQVGSALYARAESILMVSRRQLRCPRCEAVFDLRDVQQDEDVVRCPEEGCGWETTFRVCRNSWRRRHLFSGGLLPLLERFRSEYREAETPHAKMQLIDRLLHAFGRDPRTGEIGWPSVGHLVEGKSPRAVALLESLVPGPESTPGLIETREQWLKTLRLRRTAALGEGARSGT